MEKRLALLRGPALDRFLKRGAQLGGAGGHQEARGLHGLDLLRGRALAAGDDGARVAHALARGRGLAGDEARDGLGELARHVLGGILLRRAADLADHDDRVGLGVRVEQLQHVHEVGAVDRVTANAHRGGLTQAQLGELVHGLVRQRARARHHADAARLVDVARHDADLALGLGGDDAGAVRPDEAHARLALQVALGPDHVVDGDALGDGDDEGDARVRRLHDGVGREGRRHEEDRGVGAGLLHRVRHRVEDGHLALEVGATLTGGDAADELRAVLQHLLRVERTGRARDALAEDLRIVIDEDAHGFLKGVWVSEEARDLLDRRHGLLRGLPQVVRRGDGKARVAQELLALLHVGALEPHHEGDLELDFLGGGDDALGDDVTLHDAAEDVDEHRLHRRVGQDELEGRRHLLLARAAAHVQEVGRVAPHQLDGVHGGHGQARAVHHAADVAVQRDVGQVELLGLRLAGLLFRQVAVVEQLLVLEERVLVEGHLRVERHHAAVLQDDERVDLHQRRVRLRVHLVERGAELDELVHRGAREAQAEGQLAALEVQEAHRRVHRLAEDLLRVLGGHFLDLHAALAGGHEGDARGGAVQRHAQVQLLADGEPLLDVDLVDRLPLGAGLDGLQLHAQHRLGELLRLGGALGQLDAAALAAAARVDLRLHHDHRRGQLLGRGFRLIGREREDAPGSGDAVLPEEFLALVLVDLHRGSG
ncbi:conserved hypothetical protein [Stigmatella aurantiaca DW4/3-1]|uniref:NAD-specific glutamate dehydrogenase n=1 Tax=Stigmatella aurantiaca (strain DW4/3-1) TaxID=378806 RepID=Q08WT9_STIAD|nr:conserved hypothetical protein [Stigmatella aurantiaca DW4/3-1]